MREPITQDSVPKEHAPNRFLKHFYATIRLSRTCWLLAFAENHDRKSSEANGEICLHPFNQPT